MPSAPADFSIEARWILPMSGGAPLLEHHALIVRDGRIVDVLPRAEAARAYVPTMTAVRPTHLLLPGLIDTAARPLDPTLARDGALAAIGEMLRAGITCFAARDQVPEEAAHAAADQGMRAVIGLPVPAPARESPRPRPDDLSRALALRDEYQAHPLISTAFAPRAVNAMTDAAFARLATLADELDARIVLDLHASAAEIDESLRRHGRRPIERLNQLGLLTPSLHAVHLCHASPADIALAARTGIAVSVCPFADLEREGTLPPLAALAAAGIRAGIGSGGAPHQPRDLWTDMRLIAALRRTGSAAADAHETLAMATRAAAAVLGLDAEIGSLESGKWADLCCVDLSGPSSSLEHDPTMQLVFRGGRDMVSDVWVAGRQLLSESVLTRLDWPPGG